MVEFGSLWPNHCCNSNSDRGSLALQSCEATVDRARWLAPSRCQRIDPTRNRRISSERKPANSHTMITARSISSGYHDPDLSDSGHRDVLLHPHAAERFYGPDLAQPGRRVTRIEVCQQRPSVSANYLGIRLALSFRRRQADSHPREGHNDQPTRQDCARATIQGRQSQGN